MPLLPSDVIASYDYLIFAQFWMVGECCSDNNYSKNCSVIRPEISIHGLWPTFNNGSWPEYCQNIPFNTSILPQDISNYWYSSDGDNNLFYEHEWRKHGTCMNTSQSDYFNLALFLDKQLQANITDNPLKLKSEYPRRIKLVCNACILEQIYSCWDKEIYPIECNDERKVWMQNDREYTDCSGCVKLNLCLDP